MYDIGTGLNEGYTQVLNERYFYSKGTYIGCYSLFVRFASYLEVLVGQEKMESLYFKADLEGLIQELEKYASRDEVLRLIKDIDYIFEATYYAFMPLPKIISRLRYQRVLMTISSMLKVKKEMDKSVTNCELRDEKALLYSLQNYSYKNGIDHYKTSRSVQKKIKRIENAYYNKGIYSTDWRKSA